LKISSIGRFQVMALLQAARYYTIHKDMNKAKSFGLNRAIFYAWAKHYGPHTSAWRKIKLEEVLRRRVLEEYKKAKCPEGYVEVLGECVQVSKSGYYVIGEKEQTPVDYDNQVTRRLRKIMDPEKAWKAALEYVKQFPEWVLKDPQRFYKLVYEPIRDEFFKYLIREEQPKPPQQLIGRIQSLEEAYKKAKKQQRTLLDFTR